MRIDGKTLPNNPMKAYQQGKLIGTKQNMRNCQGKHKYSRNRIIVPGISEATFRRRKEIFLFDIATYCGFDRKDEPNST